MGLEPLGFFSTRTGVEFIFSPVGVRGPWSVINKTVSDLVGNVVVRRIPSVGVAGTSFLTGLARRLISWNGDTVDMGSVPFP